MKERERRESVLLIENRKNEKWKKQHNSYPKK